MAEPQLHEVPLFVSAAEADVRNGRRRARHLLVAVAFLVAAGIGVASLKFFLPDGPRLVFGPTLYALALAFICFGGRALYLSIQDYAALSEFTARIDQIKASSNLAAERVRSPDAAFHHGGTARIPIKYADMQSATTELAGSAEEFLERTTDAPEA